MRSLRLVLVTWLLCLGLPSAAQTVGYVCRAERAKGQYRFTARYADLVKSRPRESSGEIWGVEVRRATDEGVEFVWGVRWEHGNPVKVLTYGEIPPGYSQYFPDRGAPHSLRQGEEYELTCGPGRGRFRITGAGVENIPP